MDIQRSFTTMEPLNKVSLGLFVTGKLFGMLGVCLGFCGREYLQMGGFLLVAAFVSIGLAISCSLVQVAKDRKKFESEDAEVSKRRRLEEKRIELENQIKELEQRKDMLQNLFVSRKF